MRRTLRVRRRPLAGRSRVGASHGTTTAIGAAYAGRRGHRTAPLPGIDDHPRAAELRAWLEPHPSPTGRQLAERGLVAPHWPAPWGLGADPRTPAGGRRGAAPGRGAAPREHHRDRLGRARPSLHAGTEEQKERYLLPLLAADEIWCQLFSEPGAGSDLASLTTRAELDGDEWVVQGQKVWTSYAHQAEFGILLARTEPDAPKHQGISYFVCPMDAPGITVRPLLDMTGAHTFNEVFLDEVRIPADNLVGERGRGWSLAKVTLGNERVSLSGAGALWGMGPTADDLVATVRAAGGVTRPVAAPAPGVACGSEGEILRLLRMRTVAAAVAGVPPGAGGLGPQGAGRRARPAPDGAGP